MLMPRLQVVGLRSSVDLMSLPEQERRLLVQALGRTGGNQTQAAQLLSITRDALRYRMKKFHLD
jgi:two-component system response regulator AtoC